MPSDEFERSRDDIVVWTAATEHATPGDVERAYALLSADERARAGRLVHAETCRDYILAHELLRRCLSARYTDDPRTWAFEVDALGKPHLVGRPEVAFSLSHTRGAVACAVGGSEPIGVDVERVRPTDALEIAQRHFSADDVEVVVECDGSERLVRFFELWTLKEAFSKAVGQGLQLPLDRTSFRVNETGEVWSRLPDTYGASDWHFWIRKLAPDGVVALAVRSARRPRVNVLDLSTGCANGDLPQTDAPAARRTR